MDRLLLAAHQGMPPRQVFTVGQQTVGTGGGHPVQLLHILRCQGDAVWHFHGAIGVVAALAGVTVQEAAGNVGIFQLARVFVFQLDEAAFRTSIAEGFPLLPAHVGHLFGLPEGLLGQFLIHKGIAIICIAGQ